MEIWTLPFSVGIRGLFGISLWSVFNTLGVGFLDVRPVHRSIRKVFSEQLGPIVQRRNSESTGESRAKLSSQVPGRPGNKRKLTIPRFDSGPTTRSFVTGSINNFNGQRLAERTAVLA